MCEAAKEEGGCLCGAIRYTATGAPKWIANCHCQSCRKQTGAVFSTYAGYLETQVTFTRAPAVFHSSEGVSRGHCPDCGTPIFYKGARWPGEIHLHIGTFDRPERFKPQGDAFKEEKVAWVTI